MSYFDRLEHELGTRCGAGAHRRRIRRLRTPGGLTRLPGLLAAGMSVAVAVLVAVLALSLHHSSVGSGAPPPGGSPAAQLAALPPAQRREAIAALRRIYRTRLDGAACAAARAGRPVPSGPASVVALRAHLAVLRSALTRPELLAVRALDLPGGTIAYRSSARLARTAFGLRYFIVPTLANPGYTRACVRDVRARVRREAARLPGSVRSAVLAYLPTVTVLEQQQPAVEVSAVARRSGWGYGPVGLDQLRAGPPTLSTSGEPARATAFGVVPDGVASVQVPFEGQGRTVTRTARVVGNVFVIPIPRGFHPSSEASSGAGIVWRAADGHAVPSRHGMGAAAVSGYGYSSGPVQRRSPGAGTTAGSRGGHTVRLPPTSARGARPPRRAAGRGS